MRSARAACTSQSVRCRLNTESIILPDVTFIVLSCPASLTLPSLNAAPRCAPFASGRVLVSLDGRSQSPYTVQVHWVSHCRKTRRFGYCLRSALLVLSPSSVTSPGQSLRTANFWDSRRHYPSTVPGAIRTVTVVPGAVVSRCECPLCQTCAPERHRASQE